MRSFIKGKRRTKDNQNTRPTTNIQHDVDGYIFFIEKIGFVGSKAYVFLVLQTIVIKRTVFKYI